MYFLFLWMPNSISFPQTFLGSVGRSAQLGHSPPGVLGSPIRHCVSAERRRTRFPFPAGPPTELLLVGSGRRNSLLNSSGAVSYLPVYLALAITIGTYNLAFATTDTTLDSGGEVRYYPSAVASLAFDNTFAVTCRTSHFVDLLGYSVCFDSHLVGTSTLDIVKGNLDSSSSPVPRATCESLWHRTNISSLSIPTPQSVISHITIRG